MQIWLLQLGVIILAALICGAVAERLGQSRVVGEIAAGLLLGPSILGAVDIDLYHSLFSSATMPAMSQLGEFGLILLMFQLGLHLDVNSLQGRARMTAPLAISLLGMIIPFVLGCAIGVISRPIVAPQVTPLGYILFCGLALSISAVPVMARIVMDLRMTGAPAATLAMAAATFTDLLGWLMLAVIAALAAGTFSFGQTLRDLGLLCAFVAASVLIARPLWQRLLNRRKEMAMSPAILACVICYVLLSSWITATIGFHSAFGALMAALVLRGQPELVQAWRQRIEGFVELVLMPVFFAYAGIRVSLGSVQSADFWPWFFLFLAAAILGKFGGSYLGARLSGISHRDARVIGALMNTRGLMELIVLTIGLQLGILPVPVYSMLVLMALVTTAMTVPLLRRWQRQESVVADDRKMDEEDPMPI
ncbi:sodium/hydrogen exchanger family protein [Collimonas arenae]|uniref:Sodium/hydrogen exchanger family protein n=1 Tax=Collimonas arenae TaxID=279058 RepID=A0A127PUL1_9BURK|nr:cation:proton antiporter [Collimonas arenae]AMP01467.1 sodium/hydrogen exchanger family protein [Collimonas arenae]AMP11369.1 sodium/hydrogen exchanger family protein [Collimonas arenae]